MALDQVEAFASRRRSKRMDRSRARYGPFVRQVQGVQRHLLSPKRLHKGFVEFPKDGDPVVLVALAEMPGDLESDLLRTTGRKLPNHMQDLHGADPASMTSPSP